MKVQAASRWAAALAGLISALVAAGPARAENVTVEVDHAVLLRLDADADIVHVANPSIADVALESPRLIFVVGLTPGQTGLYILDGNGEEMLAGSILVTPAASNEVTLNRNTLEITYACAPRCTEVEVSGQAAAPPVDTSAAGASSDVGSDIE